MFVSRVPRAADFVLMDDNTRPHRKNIVNESVQSWDFTRKDLPVFSLDFNPVEHVGSLVDELQPFNHLPPSQPELWIALLDKWCNIPQTQTDSLIRTLLYSLETQTNVNHPTKHIILGQKPGCSSRGGIMVSDRGLPCHEFSPSTTKKTRRVGRLDTR
ncbi:transposable element Tcb1 transposase [Trichonephila clavipes]|nr:transposable element Tcb1 transposase [Trichonephila clavipes]